MEHKPLNIFLNCKFARALIHFKQDFSLSWREKLGLKSHLLICKSCSNTEKNTTILRMLLKKWRESTDDN